MMRRIVFAGAGLLVLGLIAGVARVRLSTDVLGLLPRETPGVEALQRLNAHLSDERRLLVLVEAAAGGALEDEEALERLTQVLQQVPGTRATEAGLEEQMEDGDFPALLAWLWLNAEPQVFQAQVQRCGGGGVTAVLEKARQAVATGLDPLEVTRAAYDPLGWTRHPLLDWARANVEAMQASSDAARLILLKADDKLDGYKDYAEWIGRLRAQIADFQQQSGLGWRISVTGSPTFAAEIGSAMEEDMGGTAGTAGLLVVLLFLGFQRSLRQLLAIGTCVVLILAVTLGAFGWVFGDLGVVSAGFAAILIGLTVDYAMVMSREIDAMGGDVQAARRHARRGILWGAITTAAPFGVMMFSNMPGGRQLGFLVLTGLLAGALTMLWLYPAAAFGKTPPRAPTVLPLTSVPWRLAAGIGAALLIVLVVLGFLAGRPPGISFDTAMLRPADSRAMEGLERLQTHFPDWGEGTIHLVQEEDAVADVPAAVKEIDALRAEGIVSAAWLPVDLLPQEARFSANLKWLRETHPALAAQAAAALDQAGFTEKAAVLLHRMSACWQRWQPGAAPQAFAEVRGHPLLKARLLPGDAAHGWAAVGGLRLAVTLEPELHQRLRKLDQYGFVAAGWPMLKHDLNPLLEQDIQRIFLPMMGALLVCLMLALRDWRDTLAAMGVLLLGIGGVVLVIGRHQESWSFLNIIGVVLLMGTGLDYTLHMIFALRRQRGDARRVVRSTGMAVIFCALTTVIGFGALMLASNRAMAELGFVTAGGILVMMLLAVFMLPGWWQAAHRGRPPSA